MTTVLVVDDDPALVRTLALNLRARDYRVLTAGSGAAALAACADQPPPDLALLDIGLPDIDGITVLRRLRAFSELPVIIVSARHDSGDKVRALDSGADDYVTKPFGMDELLARVRAALRHRSAGGGEPRIIATESLWIDFDQHQARRNDQAVHLTPTEWNILDVLTRSPGALVRQTDLLQQVWGSAYQRETNYLRVYLSQLRRKLEVDPGAPRHFLTEPGLGYRFQP
jgi:two-component system KDP operon response regulator KdpE